MTAERLTLSALALLALLILVTGGWREPEPTSGVVVRFREFFRDLLSFPFARLLWRSPFGPLGAISLLGYLALVIVDTLLLSEAVMWVLRTEHGAVVTVRRHITGYGALCLLNILVLWDLVFWSFDRFYDFAVGGVMVGFGARVIVTMVVALISIACHYFWIRRGLT